MICDFGRVGAWFGSTAFYVVPDIMSCAKTITLGYTPLGAVMVHKEIADAFLDDEANKFMHGVNFGGHSASCAAALANIVILEREQPTKRAAEIGDYMLRELSAAIGDHPNVGNIRGKGMFVAIELACDRVSRATGRS